MARRVRDNPKHRKIGAAPAGVDLKEVARQVSYTGSPYHKDMPSFAGAPQHRRADASICPRELANRQADINDWLRAAVLAGQFGTRWESGFPRYVWHREGEVIYEARLTNAGTGEYHGYPLESLQRVEDLR